MPASPRLIPVGDLRTATPARRHVDFGHSLETPAGLSLLLKEHCLWEGRRPPEPLEQRPVLALNGLAPRLLELSLEFHLR